MSSVDRSTETHDYQRDLLGFDVCFWQFAHYEDKYLAIQNNSHNTIIDSKTTIRSELNSE